MPSEDAHVGGSGLSTSEALIHVFAAVLYSFSCNSIEQVLFYGSCAFATDAPGSRRTAPHVNSAGSNKSVSW